MLMHSYLYDKLIQINPYELFLLCYIYAEFSIAIKSLPKLVFGYNFLYFNFFVLTVYLQILIFLARIVLSSVLGLSK